MQIDAIIKKIYSLFIVCRLFYNKQLTYLDDIKDILPLIVVLNICMQTTAAYECNTQTRSLTWIKKVIHSLDVYNFF